MPDLPESPTYQDPAKTQQVTSNQPPPDRTPGSLSGSTSFAWTVIVVVLAIALVLGAIHYGNIFSSGPQPLVTYNSASPDAGPSAPAASGAAASSTIQSQGSMPPPAASSGQGSTY